MTVTVHWATLAVSANPKVNPKPTDRHTVWCAGWTRYEVPSADEARRLFELCFPTDRITALVS